MLLEIISWKGSAATNKKNKTKKTSPECTAITCVVSLRVSDETPAGCFLDLFVFNQEMQTIVF